MLETTLPKLSPSTLELLYGMGHTQIGRQHYEDALTLFRLLTFHEVGEQSYWIGLGMAHQGLKNYKNALEAYGKAAPLGQDNPHVHLRAAECFFALEQKPKALQALDCARNALHFNPDDQLKAQIELLRTIWR